MESRSRWRAIIVICLLATIAVAILSYVIISLSQTKIHAPIAEEKLVSSCIATYLNIAKPQNADLDWLNKLNGFCYNSARSQLIVDEENIRKDNFIFQRYENIVLLFMVVMITLSGVALAGLQLLASYKLAVLGRGELAGGGEISYAKDAVSFKSSVVGLVILFISFAFFMVFVHDVYTLKEVTSSAASQPGILATENTPLRNLLPAPLPAIGNSQSAPQTAVKPPTTTTPPAQP